MPWGSVSVFSSVGGGAARDGTLVTDAMGDKRQICSGCLVSWFAWPSPTLQYIPSRRRLFQKSDDQVAKAAPPALPEPRGIQNGHHPNGEAAQCPGMSWDPACPTMGQRIIWYNRGHLKHFSPTVELPAPMLALLAALLAHFPPRFYTPRIPERQSIWPHISSARS